SGNVQRAEEASMAQGENGRQPLVEIVPNFSEGRRQGVIDAIIEALLVPGVRLLNKQWDPDHNRLDASLVGAPEAVRASALDGAKGKRLPDFGPREIGKAGAVAVGARKPLVAFNVYLSGTDEAAAKDIARRVRESTGGLKNVRAIGFFVPERGCVTISMNLVDVEATPISRAFELVRSEASRYGMHITSSEVVGLVPAAAVADVSSFY